METATNTVSAINLLDRASFQLQEFFYIIVIIGYAFLSVVNKSLWFTVEPDFLGHDLSYTLLLAQLKHIIHCLTRLTLLVWSLQMFNNHC